MRAPPLLLLLLMAAAGLAESPLARLNPWLSACDLEEASADGACDAACGGGGAGTLAAGDVAALCALGAGARARRLGALRLRSCCERAPASALDRAARAAVQAGGPRCERTLRDLLQLDRMVARVHCDFLDVLQRYDCEQPYSVHTCHECQETYRRWACSTMVPLWVEEGEDEAPARARRARHLERVGHLDRRRARGRRVRAAAAAAAAGPGRPLARLKPCLSVCQLVEQHCPYFLPADRAPAYPTQYAGEPTFLCLDERIPETGAQLNNSNYGADACCYWHCDGRLCYRCSRRLEEEARPPPELCPPVDDRAPACAPPGYPAPAPAPAPAPSPALLAALSAAALAAPSLRTFVPVPIVNVRDSRL